MIAYLIHTRMCIKLVDDEFIRVTDILCLPFDAGIRKGLIESRYRAETSGANSRKDFSIISETSKESQNLAELTFSKFRVPEMKIR